MSAVSIVADRDIRTPAQAGTTKARWRITRRGWLYIALVAVLCLKVGEVSLGNKGYSWGLLEGLSMYPRVKDLDFWVAKTQTKPSLAYGDLALFECEGDRLIKEVIALEGDRVQVANIRDAGGLPITTILVNGKQITANERPFVWFVLTGDVRLGQVVIVPRGKVLLVPVNKQAAEKRLYLVERERATRVMYNCSFVPERLVTWWRCRQGSSEDYIKYAKGDTQ